MEKTPTEALNEAVAEAAQLIKEEMQEVKLRCELLNEQVQMLEKLGHTLSELQIRAEPYDFASAMGKIMGQGPIRFNGPEGMKQ